MRIHDASGHLAQGMLMASFRVAVPASRALPLADTGRKISVVGQPLPMDPESPELPKNKPLSLASVPQTRVTLEGDVPRALQPLV